MTITQTLDKDVREYCDELYDKNVRNLYNLPQLAIVGRWMDASKKFFHVVASSCCFVDSEIFHDRSGSYVNVKWCKKLDDERERKFGIAFGETPAGQLFKLGECAEQHAANKLLSDKATAAKHPDPELSDIYFSPARRPKTFEWVAACGNCQKFFPNAK